jgi:signal transduction histidine kinase/ActR/RegA family two-component response regulator
MDEHRRSETGSWREQLLLTLTHWSALFGGVIAIGVTIRALAFDFVDVRHPAFAAMFAGYGAIVALRLLPGLPYRVRAVALSAAWFIAAGSAVLLRGLAPAPVLVVGLGVLIAALFLGRAGMLGGLLLAGAVVAIVGRPEPPETFSPWSSAIDVVCVAGVLTVLVQFVVSRLERSLEHTSQALERLQVEQELREHAQDQLGRAQATLQQTQKLDAVGRLAGGVAHDFNNTLQVVIGWTELLRSETHSQQIQEGIEQIRSAAERSRGLTRQLLAFSRPELSQPTRMELHTFLPALVKSYRRLLPDDISIVARTVQGLAILMDEGHLSQVLLNIVLNARDAMPAGGTIAVMAKFIPRAELPSMADGFENGAIEIEVTDTGTGMDEETRSRVFEPFFTTKGKRGTGLGLSTAYGVVQLADGVIDIHSERGKGTSVRLFFPPLTGAADAQPAGRPPSLPYVAQAVLLAEDDAGVRTTLARALRQAGHRVVEVSDVEAGRVVVRDRGAEFDVLVTDGIMPGGSTRQLIDDFLMARPDGRVIVCSGYIDDELSIRDLGAQTFEFVQKPFSPSELVARLGSASAQLRKVAVPADQ